MGAKKHRPRPQRSLKISSSSNAYSSIPDPAPGLPSRCLRCLKYMDTDERIVCEFGFGRIVRFRCADNKFKSIKMSEGLSQNSRTGWILYKFGLFALLWPSVLQIERFWRPFRRNRRAGWNETHHRWVKTVGRLYPQTDQRRPDDLRGWSLSRESSVFCFCFLKEQMPTGAAS